MLIGCIFIVMAIIVAITTPLILKRIKEGGGNVRKTPNANSGKKSEKQKKAKNSMKDLWDIKDIKQGVIITPGLYSVVLSINPVNFMLMSEQEQHSIETTLMQFVTALPAGSNVQFITTTELAEPEKGIKDIVETNEYAVEMVKYLDAITGARNIYVRRSYVVISIKTTRDYEYARAELTRRTSILMNNLSRAKITSYLLDTGQIVDLLHKMFNRGSMLKPTELVSDGALELFKTGGKGVGYAGSKNVQDGEGSSEVA